MRVKTVRFKRIKEITEEKKKNICSFLLAYVGISQQQVGRDQFDRSGAVDVLGASQVELGGGQSLLVFPLRQLALSHQPADLYQLLLKVEGQNQEARQAALRVFQPVLIKASNSFDYIVEEMLLSSNILSVSSCVSKTSAQFFFYSPPSFPKSSDIFADKGKKKDPDLLFLICCVLCLGKSCN